MKKVDPSSEKDLRPEYLREDLGKGVRGKYYKAYIKGTNLAQASTRPSRRSKGTRRENRAKP